jgi:hypothetical protein
VQHRIVEVGVDLAPTARAHRLGLAAAFRQRRVGRLDTVLGDRPAVGRTLGDGVGAGSANTELMKNQSGAGNTTNNAALLALSYGADDGSVGQWYVPSNSELNAALSFALDRNNFGGFVLGNSGWYWSSTEVEGEGGQIKAAAYNLYPQVAALKEWLLYLRPIRAF